MVEKLKEQKDALLRRLEQVINEKGPERMNIQEAGMLADQIKDLAEAEKACWEAEYFRSVTEAMDSSGYMPEGMGYQNGQGANGRMGYNPNRDSMGRYSRGRRGYHEGMDGIRAEMQFASPEEKEKLKRELRQILDM